MSHAALDLFRRLLQNFTPLLRQRVSAFQRFTGAAVQLHKLLIRKLAVPTGPVEKASLPVLVEGRQAMWVQSWGGGPDSAAR